MRVKLTIYCLAEGTAERDLVTVDRKIHAIVHESKPRFAQGRFKR